MRDMYRAVRAEDFPPTVEITFRDGAEAQTLTYQKVTWDIDGERLGLRYGENPDQSAAMYKLVAGSVALGAVRTIQPGRYLASDVELIQSGKHPGKINITDVDAALGIMRYMSDSPCAVIVKHNNPSGVALGTTAVEAFHRALAADRIAAFGGAVALNRSVDTELAQALGEHYLEVVAAPDYQPAALEYLSTKKNLRVMRIQNIARLQEFAAERFLDFKSLIDGGLIAQWSFQPKVLGPEELLPAQVEHKGAVYRIERAPTPAEQADMRFGWLVESGVTSNSVIYVKDGVTVAIGTGEQDRVGVARIARDKAYRNTAERLAFAHAGIGYEQLADSKVREEIDAEVAATHGGLRGATMVSDAFFPFCDGAEVGLSEGVNAIVQPGGAMRDYEVIQLCNRYNATMVFTGQRSFRH